MSKYSTLHNINYRTIGSKKIINGLTVKFEDILTSI